MRIIFLAFCLAFLSTVRAAEVRQAKATPVIVNGSIVEATIVDGGAGYFSPPIVVIEGSSGTGAIARAEISSQGSATRIVIENGGQSYTRLTTLYLPPPDPLLGLESIQLVPALVLTNGNGMVAQISFAGHVDSTTWTPLTNLLVTSDSQIYVDADALGKAKRFYKVVMVSSGTTGGTTGGTTTGSSTGSTTGSTDGTLLAAQLEQRMEGARGRSPRKMLQQ